MWTSKHAIGWLRILRRCAACASRLLCVLQRSALLEATNKTIVPASYFSWPSRQLSMCIGALRRWSLCALLLMCARFLFVLKASALLEAHAAGVSAKLGEIVSTYLQSPSMCIRRARSKSVQRLWCMLARFLFVLEGSALLEADAAGVSAELGAGAFAYLPSDTPHRLKLRRRRRPAALRASLRPR